MKFGLAALASMVVGTSGLSTANGLSPVTRVVELLKSLGEKVENELKTEEDLFETFECWAKSVVSQKTKSNAAASARKQELETYVEDLDAGRIELTTERMDLEKEIAGHSADIEQAEALRAKEKADYEAAKTEMDQAIAALMKAIDVMDKGTKPASLLRLRASSGDTIQAREADAQAVSLVLEIARDSLSKADVIFLQRVLTGEVPVKDWKKLNRKATFKEKYGARSGDIQKTLSSLLAQFETSLKDATAKETKAVEVHGVLMNAKNEQKTKAQDALISMEVEGAARGLSKSEAMAEIEALGKQIEADTKYIGDTEAALATKTGEWKDRKQIRTDEVAAINKAIATLHSDDARDLFKKSLSSQGYLFVQVNSVVARNIALHKAFAAAGGRFDEVFERVHRWNLQDEETDDLKKKEGYEKTLEDEQFCISHCLAAGYCCNDYKVGSSQMISCSQACMMRARGSNYEEMRTDHNGICNRTGQSGCRLTVNGNSYSFCQACTDLKDCGPFGMPSSGACDFGARLNPPSANPVQVTTSTRTSTTSSSLTVTSTSTSTTSSSLEVTSTSTSTTSSSLEVTSTSTSTTSSSLEAGGRFVKVFESIDKMVANLQDEEADDLKKKEGCEKTREEDTRKAIVLSRAMDELSDTIQRLKEEIEELQKQIEEKNEAIAKIEEELKEAKRMRDDQNTEWKQSDSDDKEAALIVGKAIDVLTEFYTSLALVQQKAHQPVEGMKGGEAPPPPPSTWETSYKGAQDDQTGVVAIMGMVKSDIEKDQAKAKEEEDASQKAYETFKAENEQQIKDFEKAISEMEGTIADKEGEVQDAEKDRLTKKGELETILKKIKDATPGCDFFTVNFETRLENRQVELDGLKQAKQALSGATFSL